MIRVFLSYSHSDEQLKNKLEAHLAMLKRSGDIEVWHDRELVVGDHLDNEISEYLETADLIIFLVSADFLNSYYCYEREMSRAMERVSEGTARIAPIVLRACDWKSAPFAPYVLTPTDAKPVVEHPDIDAAFLLVVTQLRQAIVKIQLIAHKDPAENVLRRVELPVSEDKVEEPRSSNLRVRKEFTDADRSRFQDEAFEFILKFFVNSIDELTSRNEDIEGRVKRITEEKFTVEVFRSGSRLSVASIFIGRSFSRSGMISYSSSLESGDNSMNGGFTVDNDDQMLFLKPMMFWSRMGGGEDAKLSLHGAAELLWEKVIEPLQR